MNSISAILTIFSIFLSFSCAARRTSADENKQSNDMVGDLPEIAAGGRTGMLMNERGNSESATGVKEKKRSGWDFSKYLKARRVLYKHRLRAIDNDLNNEMAMSLSSSTGVKNGPAIPSDVMNNGMAMIMGPSADMNNGMSSSIGTSTNMNNGMNAPVGTNRINGMSAPFGTIANNKMSTSVGTSANTNNGMSMSMGTDNVSNNKMGTSIGTSSNFNYGYGTGIKNGGSFGNGMIMPLGQSMSYQSALQMSPDTNSGTSMDTGLKWNAQTGMFSGSNTGWNIGSNTGSSAGLKTRSNFGTAINNNMDRSQSASILSDSSYGIDTAFRSAGMK